MTGEILTKKEHSVIKRWIACLATMTLFHPLMQEIGVRCHTGGPSNDPFNEPAFDAMLRGLGGHVLVHHFGHSGPYLHSQERSPGHEHRSKGSKFHPGKL